MIKLLGIVVVALGFAFRLNTLAVVLCAGLVTGWVSGFTTNELMAMVGKFFVEQRTLTLPIILMVPVVGVLERHGLQERVAALIRKVSAASAGRVLWCYQALRGLSSMVGLNLGNHASMVRPLIAPMAEGAREAQGPLDESERKQIRTHAAAAENVGNFFSDDIVVAFGALLLIKGFFDTAGVVVTLRDIKLWSLPTAVWVLAGVACRIAASADHPRRWGSAAFWLILAVIFALGKQLPAAVTGYLVVALVVLAAARQVEPPVFRWPSETEREERSARHGNRLLGPVLLVPAVAVIAGFVLPVLTVSGKPLVPSGAVPLVAIGLGGVLAVFWSARLTLERPVVVLDEGGRLIQLIGWTLILPQLLAALGGIFAKAGVGDEIAHLVASALPVESPLVAVVAYCGGMALFTILLGNAYAAFPIMTLGVGLPFIVKAHGGDPAVMGALGMLSGYCGTLVTPMAANYNIVPVRLLELGSDFAVIRAQVPFAAVIWIFNAALMYLCVYRA